MNPWKILGLDVGVKILGAVLAMGPAIAMIGFLVAALAAGYAGVQAAHSALNSVMGAYSGLVWCGMSSMGATEFLYWFITGLVAALAYMLSVKIKVLAQGVMTRIVNSLSK